MLWLKYGFCRADDALIMVNGFGALIAFGSMLVYYWYSLDKPAVERKAIVILGGILSIFVSMRLKIVGTNAVGFAAMLASILMFAAPLVALVS